MMKRLRTGVRRFIIDWNEMKQAMRPMDDPIEPPKMPIKRFWELSFRTHVEIIRDTLRLYFLSLRDRDAAIAELQRDEAIIKLKEEAYLKSLNNQNQNAVIDNDIEISEIMKKIKEMFPDAKFESAKDVAKTIYDKREDIKLLAADRLQNISEAIRAFMEGYRAGKSEGVREVEEGTDIIKTHFIEFFEDRPNSEKELKSQHPDGKIGHNIENNQNSSTS